MVEEARDSTNRRGLSEVNVPFQVVMDRSWVSAWGQFIVSSPANLASSEEFSSLLNHGKGHVLKWQNSLVVFGGGAKWQVPLPVTPFSPVGVLMEEGHMSPFSLLFSFFIHSLER